MTTNHTYSMYDFLSSCGGNWRNAIFVSCSPCRHPCRNIRAGFLLTACSEGTPLVVCVQRFEGLSGQKIDPSECAGRLSRSAFESLYARYLLWQLDSDRQCALRQLDQSVSSNL